MSSDALHIANEFAEVVVERIATRNGVRLRISSPRLGYSIALDAMDLESLTWQPPLSFSNFLSDPFGPGPMGTGDGDDLDDVEVEGPTTR